MPSYVLSNFILHQFPFKSQYGSQTGDGSRLPRLAESPMGKDQVIQYLLAFLGKVLILESKQLKMRIDCCLVYYQMGQF